MRARQFRMKARPAGFGGIAIILAVGLLTLGNATATRAQQNSGSDASTKNEHPVGIGGQIGTPAGFTLKLRNPRGVSYDFMAAWDSRDFFFINAHALAERNVRPYDNLNVFFGPGAYVGVRDYNNRIDDETVVGISADVGLGYLIEQFEVFGQLTPRLDLAPATNGDLGIGVGLRYYL